MLMALMLSLRSFVGWCASEELVLRSNQRERFFFISETSGADAQELVRAELRAEVK